MKSWKEVGTTRGEGKGRQAVRGCAQSERHGELKVLLSAQDAEFTERSARNRLKRYMQERWEMREKILKKVFCKRISQRGGTWMEEELLGFESSNVPRK